MTAPNLYCVRRRCEQWGAYRISLEYLFGRQFAERRAIGQPKTLGNVDVRQMQRYRIFDLTTPDGIL